MSRWENNANGQNIAIIGRLGDTVSYNDLPSDLQTNAIATHFGAVPDNSSNGEGGVVVCGSNREVANDASLGEVFDVQNLGDPFASKDILNGQKHTIWAEVALFGGDQLRQRM